MAKLSHPKRPESRLDLEFDLGIFSDFNLEVRVPARVKAILVAAGVDREVARELGRYIAKTWLWVWKDEERHDEDFKAAREALNGLRSIEKILAKNPAAARALETRLMMKGATGADIFSGERGGAFDLKEVVGEASRECEQTRDFRRSIAERYGRKPVTKPPRLRSLHTLSIWRVLRDQGIGMNEAGRLMARIYVRIGVAAESEESKLAHTLSRTIEKQAN